MRFFEWLLQFEIEAFQVSIMSFGAFERGDGQLEWTGGADILDIPVAPGAGLALVRRFVDDLIRANLESAFVAAEAEQMFHRDFPKYRGDAIRNFSYKPLVQPALKERIRSIKRFVLH